MRVIIAKYKNMHDGLNFNFIAPRTSNRSKIANSKVEKE